MRKILLGGLDNSSLIRQIKDTNIKNVSVSFNHLDKAEFDPTEFDHTHIHPGSKSLYEKLEPEIEQYFKEYVDWLIDHRGEYNTCTEFDVAYKVGKEKRLEYRAHMETMGLMPIPVWNGFKDDLYKTLEHLDTENEWEALLLNYDIIGIAIPRNFKEENKLMQLLHVAEKKKKRILLTGVNDPVLMRKFPFYLIDTIYWLSGSRFGVTFKFNGTNLLVYDSTQKGIRETLQISVEEENLNFNDFINDDWEVINRWNAIQWRKYDEFLAQQGDYWENNKEIQVIQRNELAESMPSLICDTCFIAQRCPKFKEHSSCAFKFTVELETPNQLVEQLVNMISLQSTRLQKGVLFENIGGGGLDQQLTREFQAYGDLLKTLKEITSKKTTLTIEREESGGILKDLLSGIAEESHE